MPEGAGSEHVGVGSHGVLSPGSGHVEHSPSANMELPFPRWARRTGGGLAGKPFLDRHKWNK